MKEREEMLRQKIRDKQGLINSLREEINELERQLLEEKNGLKRGRFSYK